MIGDGIERVGGWEFQVAAPDWRVVGTSGVATWFDTSSHSAGAELVRLSLEVAGNAWSDGKALDVDLRATGLRVRIPPDGGWTAADVTVAQGISAAARQLGLAADPSVLQELEWVIDTTLDGPTLTSFWQQLLGYEGPEDDRLLDPLHRDPRLWFNEAGFNEAGFNEAGFSEAGPRPRPLRNRLHIDLSVPREQAMERATALRPESDPATVFANGWSLMVDPEGNEIDFIPGDAPDWPESDDWRLIFGGSAFYPTSDLAESSALVSRVAEIADRTGLSLLIDIRAGGVVIDTGKDLWEDERFPDVARQVQAAARGLGLTADPSRTRFVQVCIDAVDLPRVREFWRAVLGYENDPRSGVTDINDPRWLSHPFIFQQMDPTDEGRRRQRDRIHLDLFVPHDQLQARRQAALDAGGRLTSGEGSTIADPEGNEINITAPGAGDGHRPAGA